MTIESGPWRGNVQPMRERDEPQLGWISPARYQGRVPPERSWLVEGCFTRGSVGMISGDGSIGKSQIVLQLCCCAALGYPWFGLKVPVCCALYMACEDENEEIWRRVYATAQFLGREMADIGERFMWWPRVGQTCRLIEFERFTREPKQTALFSALWRKATEFGAQLIVIDTATMTFGGNQNDEIQVAAYISQLRRLAIAIQGVVIITKHPSLSGREFGTGESGSVAWTNSVRSRLYFAAKKDRDGNEIRRELRGVKNNYARLMDPIPLRWEAGVFIRDESPLQRYLEA
jgi:RecA-family ATPase